MIVIIKGGSENERHSFHKKQPSMFFANREHLLVVVVASKRFDDE